MKTKKEILAEHEKFKILDNKEALAKTNFYKGPQPMSEWAYYGDLGYKKALEWVLGIEKKEDK